MKTTVLHLAMALSLALVLSTGSALARMDGCGHGAQAATEAKCAPGETAQHSGAQSALHGGQVTMTQSHHFETLFAADGIRIFTYSADQAPQMTEKAKGVVALKFKDAPAQEIALVLQQPQKGEQTVYFCPMHKDVVQMEPGICKQCGGMKLFAQDYLYAKADLSKVALGTLEAVVALEGLKAPEAKVTFTQPFLAMAAVPAAQSAQGSAK
jgi:hypothetical protein